MTQMMKQAETMETIDALLSRLDGTQKAAEANTEAGGYQGETTHPVKAVDDRTDDAQEGVRSSENTADVKEDQGSPAVDNTPEGTPGGQDSVQLNIGTNQSATGEDSAVETDSAKGGKEDSGYDGPSSHPARTDNDSLDGHKYSSAQRVLEKIKEAQAKGTDLIAKIAVEAEGELKKRADELKAKEAGEGSAELPPETVDESDTDSSVPPPGKGKSKDAADKEAAYCEGCESDPCGCKKAEDKTADAKEAGEATAEAVTEQPDAEKLAEAQNQMILESLGETIHVAYDMADKVAEFLGAYEAEKASQAKSAMEGEEEGSDPPNPEGESEGGESSGGSGEEGGEGEGAGNPFSGGGEPPVEEAPPIDEEALLALLAGGEGGLGGLEGGLGGAPVPGAEEAMGAMGGGLGGGDEQAMLLEALAQQGLTPEAFEAKAAAKLASTMKDKDQLPTAGQWRPKNAAEAQQFQQILNYVKEYAA